MQPLVDAIKAQGVSDSDIEVTIYPSSYYGPYGTPTARVTVTLNDVSKVGSLIDAGNQAVADSGTIWIQNVGVTYSVNDCDALLAEARRAAVEDARDNGAGLAEALGVGLGGIQGATEYSLGPLRLLRLSVAVGWPGLLRVRGPVLRPLRAGGGADHLQRHHQLRYAVAPARPGRASAAIARPPRLSHPLADARMTPLWCTMVAYRLRSARRSIRETARGSASSTSREGGC